MTDLRKAAEMALEALEWNYGTDLENIENCMAWLEKMNATIPALRQALAQEEKPPVKTYCGGKPNYCTPEVTPKVTEGRIMYESEHAVRIIHCGNRLQHEMANTYAPDRNTIAALCQEIENSAHEIYKWVNGIEGKSE